MDKGHVTDSGEPEAVLAGPGVMALKNDSRPMNLLRMAQLREEGERRFGDVGGQWLQLPGEAPALGEEVFVEIPPESILLSREDVPGISARNHLRGTVRQIVVVGGASFVGVDVGQMLWAELTPGAVDELGLAKGVPVFCLIKTQSLRIV
jgi:molybdate transport system ATP-binding protein